MADSDSRLDRRLAERDKQLVPYLMAGDGGLEWTRVFLEVCDRPGVACVELGVPFSDPIADGPVLQAAARRAIEAGSSLKAVIALVEKFRRKNDTLPLAVFSYANPIAKMGLEDAFKAIAEAGADLVMMPEVPLEESAPFREAAAENGLGVVLFAAPSTDNARLMQIAEHTRGFLYLIGRYGVTGASKELGGDLDAALNRVQAVARTPVAVGFGLSTPEHVEYVHARADLAVVGSALVERLHQAEDPVAACRAFLARLMPE